MTESDFLSVSEAAERYNVDTRTIQRWIDKGEFPGSVKKNPSRRNSPYIIPMSAIKRFDKLREASSK